MGLKGNRLKQLRVNRGLTQEQLAAQLKLGKRQIHRYENGLSDPASDVVARLALALGVSADFLLGLVDEATDHYMHESLIAEERQLVAAFRQGSLRDMLRIIANRWL